MDDLDRDLRSLDAIDAPDLWQDITRRPPNRAVRLPSAGRRAWIAGFALGLSLIILVWAVIVLGPTSRGNHRQPIGAGTTGERTVTVLGVSLTSPSSWTLVDLWPVVHDIATWRGVGLAIELPPGIRDRGGLPVLQLSNQNLGLASACTGATPSGDQALLYVAENAGPYLVNPDGSPRWSHELAPGDGPCGRGMYAYREATTANLSRPYLVYAGFGPQVSEGDHQVVLDAFASLKFEWADNLPPAETTAGYVLDGLRLGETTYALEARSAFGGGIDLSLVNGGHPDADPVQLSDIGRPGDKDLDFALSGLIELASPQVWAGLPPTNVALGVFGMASDRVASVQVRVPSVGTLEPVLLPIPSSLGTSFRAFDTQVPPVSGGTVVALDAGGTQVAEEPLMQPAAPSPTVSEALPSEKAKASLRNTLVAALTYFTDGATFEGFDPAKATSIEPTVAFNSESAAIEGEVSIRDVTTQTLLLVTKSSDGNVFCIAQVGGRTTYGVADAKLVTQCDGDISAWG